MKQFLDLIACLDGRGFRGLAHRQYSVDELQKMGCGLHVALLALRHHPDENIRSQAGTAARFCGLGGWQEVVLAFLNDPAASVRYNCCGLLYDAGDDRAVSALTTRLTIDPDAGVRVIAADALGQIGSLAAVPFLVMAAERDDEEDRLGFTPAGSAREALAQILSQQDRGIAGQ
jgi:HEAT repeat protein